MGAAAVAGGLGETLKPTAPAAEGIAERRPFGKQAYCTQLAGPPSAVYAGD
jgi:hypothetical protein